MVTVKIVKDFSYGLSAESFKSKAQFAVLIKKDIVDLYLQPLLYLSFSEFITL